MSVAPLSFSHRLILRITNAFGPRRTADFGGESRSCPGWLPALGSVWCALLLTADTLGPDAGSMSGAPAEREATQAVAERFHAIAPRACGLSLYGYCGRRRNRPGWPCPSTAPSAWAAPVSPFSPAFASTTGPCHPLWNPAHRVTYWLLPQPPWHRSSGGHCGASPEPQATSQANHPSRPNRTAGSALNVLHWKFPTSQSAYGT
jgi:hypothetical protein